MRRQGAGRAFIDAMVARYPGMPSCLTATEEGFWLYASAGYRTVGLAAWWRRGQPGARRHPDRQAPVAGELQ